MLLFLGAYAGPFLTKWDYQQHDFMNFLSDPSGDHWWGTTQGGVDLFSLTMRGLQKSLIIGLLVGVISTFLAATVGAFAAYFGGWTDRVLMWVVDLLLVMPSFLIIAVLSPAFRGATWLIFVFLLGAFSWMITGRVVRSMTFTLKDREFVKAAKYMGVPRTGHHLPAHPAQHGLDADHRRRRSRSARRSSARAACRTSGSACRHRTSPSAR